MIDDRRISVAPMMNWTDRHCRYFHRLLHPQACLFTEMIHANAVINGDRDYLLGFNDAEHPVVVQLGGNHPATLARAAVICAEHGYDEINLNIGCPSERVQIGDFGACLMAQPQLVGECIAAMKAAVNVPVSVKTRIGIDAHDSYDFLHTFIAEVVAAGADVIVVHARIAILSGLSPKQNREVPPLNYSRVARIVAEFPDVPVILNGGICGLGQIKEALETYVGVMLGRAAYHNPWLLAQIAAQWQIQKTPPDRETAVRQFIPYMRQQCEAGVPLHKMTRHILGLYQGQRGARAWRRHLSENSHRSKADVSVVEAAMSLVDHGSVITYK
ncbi:MAG: tRNA dihydrouridine(20/20a) synthase DusA [Gammaproteobacteria bacterium]|nr:tRNA dihydrouridine(20/20a) synthase DusA [Gammaproteobacteria bacterium]